MLGLLLGLLLAMSGHAMDIGIGPTGSTSGTGPSHYFHLLDIGVGPTG